MKRRFVLAAACIACAICAYGASDQFTRGEEAFVQNRPKDARPLLEGSLVDDPTNETAYLYLGIVYQQLGDAQRAVDVLTRGLAVSTAHKDLLYYNMGNDLYALKQYDKAELAYTGAIESNRDAPAPYLNRANARMQLQKTDDALSDYSRYLQLAPADPQRPSIERLMALLRQAKEQAEEARKTEEARQQALLNDIQNSLNNAGDATKNLSVDSVSGQTDPVNVDIKD
jgi:tetratricopeptide (TPR) repeat protein